MTVRFDAHGVDSPLNPDNLALRQLLSQGPVDGRRFTQTTKRVPIMIRLQNGTGLTACTPMTRSLDTNDSFLSDGRYLLLATSRSGLISLMTRQGCDTAQLQTSDVAVAPAGRYDFPDALDALANGLNEDTLLGVMKVFDLGYRLSICLEFEDLAAAVSASDGQLRRFYRLAVRANNSGRSPLRAWRRLQRSKHYDLSEVAFFVNNIAARLSSHVVYYHHHLASPGAPDMAGIAFWHPAVPTLRAPDTATASTVTVSPPTTSGNADHTDSPCTACNASPATTTHQHIPNPRERAPVRHRTPPPDPQRALRAKNLSDGGMSLLASVEIAGIDANLGPAIAQLREALTVAAPNDPCRPTYWLNLAKALQASYEHQTNHDHLDEAIAFTRRAIGVVNNDHQDLPDMQCTMGMLLALRFARDTSEWDIGEAMVLTATAMRRHPDDLLATRARAHALRQRWERLQARQDLDAIIELGRTITAKQAPGPQRAETLDNLSRDLCHRHDLAEQPGDLDAAIDASHAALKDCPADHPRRPRYLYGLAYAQSRKHTGPPNSTD